MGTWSDRMDMRRYNVMKLFLPVSVETSAADSSHLPSICVIFSLVDVQQAGQTKVRDLYVVGVLHQNVAGG